VLEIGAVASTLGQSARFLSTRGARVVVAADADLAAVQEAQSRLSGPNLRFRPPVFDDFEGGSFDLVIVADLATYVRAPELLKELARLVAKNGYLMGGLRNPAGLALSSISDPEEADAPPTYGQLLDALTTHFNSIEVATQSPVLGYQIAFERGEGLQVDGSLAGHSEAAYYVVLAGQEAVRNFDPTWVQLPPEPLAFTGGRLEDASRRATEWKDRTTRLKEVLATKTTELTSREAELKEMMAQLEGAKDGVSRLTAQLETAREAPETLRERDDLANRIRRVEAELNVARERAIDAEGRATAARSELEAFSRAQKDAALQTLASQELARLERARREEVATQLEDSRNRLASAYEDLRRAQEQAATERLEHERTRVTGARLSETIAAKEADLASARDRELRLSDARTQALQAIEGLENSLSQARHQLVELREDSGKRDAERVSLERSLDVERTTRAGLKAEIEREALRAQGLQDELTQRGADLSAVETELQSTRSAQARALRDIETLSNSERTWREIAQQTDQRLVDTTANVQTLSDQLAQAEAEKESLAARARRLELDLTTVINTERGLREQTEAQLAVTGTSLKETSDDREALIVERDDLRGALEDLKKARTNDQGQADALAAERRRLDAEVNELQARLTRAIREHDEAQQASQAKEQMLQARLNEHITSLALETTSLEAAKAQLAQLEASIKTTSEALAEAQRKGQELEAGLNERTEQLVSTQQELAATQARAVQAEQGLGETRTSAEALQARLAEATAELERVRAELATTREAFAARESKLIERRELIDLEKISLEKSYKNLEATAKLAVERATDLEDRVGELSKQLRLEEDERRAERRQLEEGLEWHREELASERQTTAQQKAALAKQVADSQATASRQQADAQAALSTAAESAKALQAELETLRGQEQALQAERTSLTEALVAARSSNAELRGETEQNHSRIAALSAEVEARTRQVTATQLAQAIAMDDAAVARTTVQALEATRTGLQNEVTRLSALTVEHETRFAETTQALLSVRGSSDEVSTRLTAAVAEVEHLKAELEEGLDARAVERALVTKTESERDAAAHEVATLKASIQERDAEVATLSASLRELETTKQTVETQQGMVQTQLGAAQEQLAASKALGLELEQKLTSLTTELHETSARATRIDAALESTKQEHQAILMALREELEAARRSAAKALETKTSEAEACVATLLAALGRVDVALIAHGLLGDQLASEHSFHEAEQIAQVNYLSVVALLIPLANALEKQGDGRLAVITSVAAERGRPRNYSYAAAKGALNVYLQGLRSRLYARGVTVHTIKLGPVDTPMTVGHRKNLLFSDVSSVAGHVLRALDRRVAEAFVPPFWALIMPVVRNMPEALFQRIGSLSGR